MKKIIQPSTITFFLAILGFVITTLSESCRKVDRFPEESSSISVKDKEQKFFNNHRSADVKEKALVDFIKRKNDSHPFIEKAVERIGYPYWDKTLSFTKASTKKSGRENLETTETIYYIPFVRDSQNYVNASLIIKALPGDTTFYFVRDWQYQNRVHGSPTIDTTAERYAVFFMILDNRTFGHTEFNLIDSNLFAQAAPRPNGERKLGFVNISTPSAGRNSLMEYQEICVDFYVCGDPDWCAEHGGCDYLNCASAPGTPGYCYLVTSVCDGWWEETGGGGGGTGGSGETGGGSGGGSGSGGGDTIPDCPTGIGRTSQVVDTCGPGWIPIEDDPLPPSPIYVSDENDPYVAEYQNIRTYITPSGVPFTLPAGSKIIKYKNIDLGLYPNGALYAFELPNGDKYVAKNNWVLVSGSWVASPPYYNGFFKVNADNTIDFNSPYTDFQYPQPDNNGIVKAVRITEIKLPNGTCVLSKQIIDYEPNPGMINSGGVATYCSYDIEMYSESPGTPTQTNNLSTCSGSAPNNSYTIENFVSQDAQALATFLNNRVQNSVKVYLFDCAANTASHTITKNGVVTVPTSDQTATAQEFNNGSFSENIAIKGCLSNGKWQYEVKINSALLTAANVHPKVQQHLAEVIEEIKRQADAEAAFLTTPKQRSAGERIAAGNGEQFFKASMNLFESLSAIYDVGEHIISEGTMPETIWDQGRRTSGQDMAIKAEYQKSPFNMTTRVSGGCDQLIDEVTGVVQLVKMGIEAIRRPRATFENLHSTIKNLDTEKVKQILSSISGIDNYNAGGDRANYQVGRHSVQAAMIFFTSIKALTNGTKAVKEAGAEITAVQKFLPPGFANSPAGNALKNAAENNKLVKNIDDEKLLTKNVLNGEEKVIAIDRQFEVYDGSALNNLDELSEDVLKAADAGDMAEAAEDAVIHNHMKQQPQPFIDGKRFEKNINNDPAHKGRVQTGSGIDLTGFERADQVQIRLPNGKYIVADNVWWKRVSDGSGGFKYEVVVNESKLSPNAPFSQNQISFANYLSTGNINFTLRSTKFAPDFPQNALIEVKSYVNTVSNGSTGLDNYSVIKVF